MVAFPTPYRSHPMPTTVKVRRGSYVLHKLFGPLYVTFRFRDSGGTCWNGINGQDGVNYQFYQSECERLLTRDEFDALPKGRRKPA